ncbi:hypothetical protein DZF91_23640 [Actinomadura logoneensis]|uniref:Uncharacterized protein n=2 Tax=Actinomadura logoneensis TaxID=2293572 RepID=A0A372JGR3_9ACTN|nr:hypothetical protein DZF91_23640 [Actinomadura logoneensis]
MAQAQARLAGRFTGLPEPGAGGQQPGAHAAPDAHDPHAHPHHGGRDLDPPGRDRDHTARDLDHAARDLAHAGRELLHAGLAHAGRDLEHSGRDLDRGDLDPAIAGLIARLPGPGGRMSSTAIARWTDAARAVLTLAYTDEDEPAR